MTQEQVTKVAEAILERVKRTLNSKSAHYAAGEEDKLWNFKTQAAFEGRRPSEVCLSHMMKQITTILKATRHPMPLEFGTGTQEGILQKPVDAIAYLILWVCLQMDEQGAAYEDVFCDTRTDGSRKARSACVLCRGCAHDGKCAYFPVSEFVAGREVFSCPNFEPLVVPKCENRESI